MRSGEETAGGATPGVALRVWLGRFTEFFASKHKIASELLEQSDRDNPVFDTSRARVLASGRPLLQAAQRSGEIRDDVTLEQVFDMVIAVSAIRGEPEYREPILRAALDGLRPPAD